ncbi:uncharacterized protein TNCT_396901 [Trichonephila clavata]|uniref:H15 domain-containing protein n=1 Tax=Trichonephila clavata TaxID=2740835 RepID=A0A8X6FPX3_TRICU|nr:uncharacterized protein TNCT_640601 [Trichonephila clavata]GFQ85853.1 uncharacterized protein TNCT_396901 [Trichonephila clavata]
MKAPASSKEMKNKPSAEKNQIRRWILKSVSETTRKNAITLNAIKKFLESKQKNISRKPETKMILKRLVDSGQLVKIDGRFTAGKPSPRKKSERNQPRKNDSRKPSPVKGNKVRKTEGKRQLDSEKETTEKQSA